jgi:hypothetical protein
MKQRKYLLLTSLLISLALVFSACEKETPEPSPDETAGITSLTVSANQATMFNDSNELFIFNAVGSDEQDYTASAEFYINDAPITGSTFKTADVGVYTVYAKFGNLQSNSINIEVVDRNVLLSSMTLTTNVDEIITQSGEAFVFTVIGLRTDGSNINLSDLEGIKYYVNNTLIGGKTFAPTEIRDYTVYATFNETVTSNSITVRCIADPAIYVHRLLIEDFTGTWCGWCTRVLNGIELVHQQTDKAVVAAIHRGNASGSYYDPFNLPEGATLESQVGVTGYPTAMLSRTAKWTAPENTNISQPVDMIQAGSAYGIALSSTMGASSGTITASIHFNAALPKAKCVAYVLEDNLVCDQYNYVTNLYGGQNPIPNFNHKDVVRAVASSSILGQAIPDGESVSGNTYEVQFTASYTSLSVSNLKVMVMVLDSNNRVVNVQVAAANTTKDYELK